MFGSRRAPSRADRPTRRVAAVAEFYQQQPAARTVEDAVRDRVRGLIRRGVSQKVIAARMGVSESWLSRWLNAGAVSALTVGAMERFDAYAAELASVGRSSR